MHTYTVAQAFFDRTNSDPNPLLTFQFSVDSTIGRGNPGLWCGACLTLNTVRQAYYSGGIAAVQDVLQPLILSLYLIFQSGAPPAGGYPRASRTYFIDPADLPPLPAPDSSLTRVDCAEALAAGTWTA